MIGKLFEEKSSIFLDILGIINFFFILSSSGIHLIFIKFSNPVVLSSAWRFPNASVHLSICKLLVSKLFPYLQSTPVYRSSFQ